MFHIMLRLKKYSRWSVVTIDKLNAVLKVFLIKCTVSLSSVTLLQAIP